MAYRFPTTDAERLEKTTRTLESIIQTVEMERRCQAADADGPEPALVCLEAVAVLARSALSRPQEGEQVH